MSDRVVYDNDEMRSVARAASVQFNRLGASVGSFYTAMMIAGASEENAIYFSSTVLDRLLDEMLEKKQIEVERKLKT